MVDVDGPPSAASSKADRIWAEAIPIDTSAPRIASVPPTIRGAVPAAEVSITPPRVCSGETRRDIGRALNDASPVNVALTRDVESTPASRRIVVPEFPQSIGTEGSVQCEIPGERISGPSTRTPS